MKKSSIVAKVGDTVQWVSQSAGSWKEKVGVVVQVVPARTLPNEHDYPKLYATCGYSRDHTSYVVKVGKKFYWPVANKLKFFTTNVRQK